MKGVHLEWNVEFVLEREERVLRFGSKSRVLIEGE